MRRAGILTLLFTGGLVLLLQSAPASAQATRTWVSGVGDDVNPCSRTAPCKTFAGAISKTAAGGEINALDPGGFGGVTITKAITLDGGGGPVASILVAGTQGITVNAGASDRVVIRNLTINGASQSPSPAGLNGINIIAGGIVTLQKVRIANFGQACVNAQVAAMIAVNVFDSELASCVGGILSSGGTGINRIGVFRSNISRVATGIQAGANSNITVWNSSFSNNGTAAIQATASTAQVTIDQSTITSGNIGVQASNNSIVRLSNTSVTNNIGTGLLADTGGQILTWSNNWVGGNTPDGSRTGTIIPQ